MPTTEGRKRILSLLDLPSTFARAFDLILVPGHINTESEIQIEHKEEIQLIELKTTKKKLLENPKGFFFGATENEFTLARLLGNQYSFCFVCLHAECKSYKTLTLEALEKLIRTKRTQFQINL